MPNFHETRMGARFFESDVPRLVDAVQSIAKSLVEILKLARDESAKIEAEKKEN